MKKDKQITPVIFRKFNDGDIVAMFPEQTGSNDYWTCGSYAHIGQHGIADRGLISATEANKTTGIQRLKKGIGENKVGGLENG